MSCLFLYIINSQNRGYFRKDTVYIRIKACPLLLILLYQLLRRQDFLFLMGITAQVYVVASVRQLLRRVLLSLIKTVKVKLSPAYPDDRTMSPRSPPYYRKTGYWS